MKIFHLLLTACPQPIRMKQPLPIQRGEHPSLRAGLLLSEYKVFFLSAFAAFLSLSPFPATAQQVYLRLWG
jgi:hypothetical protein